MKERCAWIVRCEICDKRVLCPDNYNDYLYSKGWRIVENGNEEKHYCEDCTNEGNLVYANAKPLGDARRKADDLSMAFTHHLIKALMYPTDQAYNKWINEILALTKEVLERKVKTKDGRFPLEDARELFFELILSDAETLENLATISVPDMMDYESRERIIDYNSAFEKYQKVYKEWWEKGVSGALRKADIADGLNQIRNN